VVFTTGAPGQRAQIQFAAARGQNATVTLADNTPGPVNAWLLALDRTILASVTSSSRTFTRGPQLLSVAVCTRTTSRPSGRDRQHFGERDADVVPVPLAVRDAGQVKSMASGLAGLFLTNEASGTIDRNVVTGQSGVLFGTSVPVWSAAEPGRHVQRWRVVGQLH
jgi:hypothetical protein